jgi:protein-S-isoprenylcysteine O-methyltransferase Ste14
MHCRFGILYLGQVHARTKLERRRYTKGRARTDYARAYALVRHLIYTGLLTMFVATVIVLGHVAELSRCR